MKIYRLEYCDKGALYEWHENDPCRLVGLFTNKEEAEQLQEKIKSLTYDDGVRLQYDCYMREIETDIIVDNIIKEDLKEE